MYLNYLDFEQPIAELKEKINQLKALDQTSGIDIDEEVVRLEKKSEQLTRQIFSHLTTFQVVQIARHPLRPYTKDYIDRIFTDFDELHGDRHFSDGSSIIAGIARLNNEPVMVMGHQKGRKTQEKVKRNFGMPRPEAYRKTQRLLEMAERFRMPVITFIDTAGAYAGIGAEERNQSESIAKNLFMLSHLKTPIISVVTGEGGSGGALALGVGDVMAMLQYSIYSVITPEGCASILWKNSAKAADAAEAMGVTADKIKRLNLVDEIIPEPLGGAHRDYDFSALQVKKFIERSLSELKKYSLDELIENRYQRLMSYGIS